METFNTTFSDTEGKGTVTLYTNHVKGGAYVGRFDRKTVDMNTLIARIQKRKAGTNELALQQSAGFIKEEVLESLRRGEAVNLMDLGTLYISVKIEWDGKSGEPDLKESKKNLRVKFTPSPLTRAAVDSVEIKDISVASVGPEIRSVKDNFTGLEGGTVSIGKDIEIKGERLKLDDGDSSGIFFCPLNKDGTIVADEKKWLKSPRVTCNRPKTIRGYVPDNLDKKSEYRILLRTFFSNKNKQLLKEKREAASCIVRAAE